jgi:hypothetical protein
MQWQLAALMDESAAHSAEQKGQNFRRARCLLDRNFDTITAGHEIASNPRNNPQQRTRACLRVRSNLTSPGKPGRKTGHSHDCCIRNTWHRTLPSHPTPP